MTGERCCRPQCLLPRYERMKGLPPQSVVDALQAACHQIINPKQTWNDFLSAVEVQPMDDLAIHSWLIRSSLNSGRKKYHSSYSFERKADARLARRMNAQAVREHWQQEDNYDLCIAVGTVVSGKLEMLGS